MAHTTNIKIIKYLTAVLVYINVCADAERDCSYLFYMIPPPPSPLPLIPH
jgi:hypothetical protein